MIFEGLFCYKLNEVFVILWYNGGMNEIELEYFKSKLQNLMNLRSAYFAVVIAVTGGVVSLFRDVSILNLILIPIGLLIDYFFLSQIFNITTQINKIIKQIRGL